MNLQSDKVFYHCKPLRDTEAFKDAQLMARIAVNNLSSNIPADAFWFAAMQTLKAAYAGEKK
ncbi:TPA: hypothetical protein G7958_004588 [Salmonella enterica]|uniref:Uncharacterized protein n=1 Tax=Salmonella enterica TaxID=28901 RepID=A0A748ZHD7_SALER|nr:hypothetical protein [Salmonella enterica]